MQRKLVLLPLALSATAFTQQPSYTAVPLKECDRLLLAPVRIDGKSYDFLLDTGATTILNSQTFRGGERSVTINSFRGESTMSGSSVQVHDLQFGSSQLRDLSFKAIDLSPIANACGGRVDGLLGIDLLSKLEASIDVKRKIARIPLKRNSPEFAALRERMTRCNDLFNAGDASHFREQFAADIVWLTPYGEIRGRDAVVAHLENNFVRKGATMTADLKPEDFHLEGDTYWMNYECKVMLPERTLRYRATLISKLHGDKWQVQSAHYSPIAQ